MNTDVSVPGPFEQPFNKTSSAVRHTGSLMLGIPAENTLPPVSKLLVPLEAQALSCGVYLNLLGRFYLFPSSRLRHLGEPQHIGNWFLFGILIQDYMSISDDRLLVQPMLLSGPHLQLIRLCLKYRMMDVEKSGQAGSVCRTFRTLRVTETP